MVFLDPLGFAGRRDGAGTMDGTREEVVVGKANALGPEAQAPGLGDLGECYVFDIAVVPLLVRLPDSPECTQGTRKHVPRAQNPG